MRQAENELLTRVGPGTPAGELLRRYWHPVAVAGELTEEKPIKAVKLLGEKLVVFRLPMAPGDTQPRYGLVAEQCRHRLASLAYGKVDHEGIRCPYHGWKYDLAGRCLETPPEPSDSKYYREIRQPAYPVEKLSGLLWAYLGPEPVPLLPRWDVFAREDGRRWITIESVIDCNWLQPMENSVDPSHLYWLHGFAFNSGHLPAHMAQYQEKHEFIRYEYGIMKRRITPGRNPSDPPMVDEHPLIFPTMLRHVSNETRGKREAAVYRHNMQIRVPLDDTHTQVYRVNFIPSATERSPADQDPPYEYRPLKNAEGEYYMDVVSAQDSMAWETQGPITDRTQEHLGAADRGIVILRKLLRDQIEIVRNGGEPMGIIRDPDKNRILHIDVINERIGLYRATPAGQVRAEAS
jgi:5,5'-dehydrodivanillate O-demethylase oxygenase subunit